MYNDDYGVAEKAFVSSFLIAFIFFAAIDSVVQPSVGAVAVAVVAYRLSIRMFLSFQKVRLFDVTLSDVQIAELRRQYPNMHAALAIQSLANSKLPT